VNDSVSLSLHFIQDKGSEFAFLLKVMRSPLQSWGREKSF